MSSTITIRSSVFHLVDMQLRGTIVLNTQAQTTCSDGVIYFNKIM